MDLSVVIPYRNGDQYIGRLLASLPEHLPVIVIDDQSDRPPNLNRWPHVEYHRLENRGYFAGAVNEGIRRAKGDVLVLNQDVYFTNNGWLNLLVSSRNTHAMIGERIKGRHPAFAHGYIHGTFMFMRRDAIENVGVLNENLYPLWGGTAEWQARAARAGYQVMPLVSIPGFVHARRGNYGSSIRDALTNQSDQKAKFLRTPPEISVVIPCYNHGRYLRDAVHSMIGGPTSLGDHPGQTMQSFEIIIVDDASTDDSQQVGEALADGWKLIRYIRREKNGGTAAAHNTGISQANGRYITCMSADDMREPDALRLLYETCIANPHSFAYDDVVRFTNGNRREYQAMEEYDFDRLIHKNQIHVGIMYPKQAWKDAGGYDERMRHGREDWQFNVALGLKGWCGVHVRKGNYLYRREGQNRTLTNTTPMWHQEFSQTIRQIHPEAYGRNRPMACCGGRRSTNTRTVSRSAKSGRTMAARISNRRTAMAPKTRTNVMPEGMVQVEYQGSSSGSTTWGGPGRTATGRTYRFANSDRQRVRWVDQRDLEYFEALEEGGKKTFKVLDTKTTSGEKVSDLQKQAEEKQAQQKQADETQAGETQVKEASEYNVDELEKLVETADADTVRRLLESEKSDKKRVTAIDALESRLEDLEEE